MDKKGGPGPVKRFDEIEARLKAGKYNRETRKANRGYLEKYLKDRANIGSNAVEARKAVAVALRDDINAYKSPAAPVAAKVTPPAPKGNATKKKARTKTPPPPVRPRTPPPKKEDLYIQKDVAGDGNCYYRALYRAAAEHEDPRILERVFTILGADKKAMGSEETGHVALRAAIAEYYRTKFLERAGPYEMLVANFGSMTFRLWLREATSRQAAIYRKIKTYAKKKDGKKEFYEDLAKVIGTNKEYASDIDYMIISEILETGGVKVVSTQVSPTSGIFDGKPALYIKRLSYDHYNYWRLKVLPKPAPAAPAPAAAAPAAAAPAAAAEKPAAAAAEAKAAAPEPTAKSTASSNVSNASTNANEERRIELMEELEQRMDKHTRCVEKCKALGKQVDATKAALKALGKP